jgi:hypothetical protein
MEQINTTQKLVSNTNMAIRDSKIIDLINDHLSSQELKTLISTTAENNITQLDSSLSTLTILNNNLEINNSNLISSNLISSIPTLENDKNVELLSTTLNVNDKKIEFYDLSSNLFSNTNNL